MPIVDDARSVQPDTRYTCISTVAQGRARAMSAERAREGAVDRPLSPGQHLRAEIERLGLDQVALCKAAGVSRQTINNIVNDRQAISRAMAGQLARITGRSSDY